MSAAEISFKESYRFKYNICLQAYSVWILECTFHFSCFLLLPTSILSPKTPQKLPKLPYFSSQKNSCLTLCFDGLAGFCTLFTLFSGPPFLATPFSSMATGMSKNSRQISQNFTLRTLHFYTQNNFFRNFIHTSKLPSNLCLRQPLVPSAAGGRLCSERARRQA